MARIVVHIDPDGVNGGIDIYGDVGETEVVVCRGPNGDVVASKNVPPEPLAQYVITVFDETAREELQGKIGDLTDEFGNGSLDYEVIEL